MLHYYRYLLRRQSRPNGISLSLSQYLRLTIVIFNGTARKFNVAFFSDYQTHLSLKKNVFQKLQIRILLLPKAVVDQTRNLHLIIAAFNEISTNRLIDPFFHR